MTWKDAADGFVILAAVKVAWITVAIIFTGTEPFLAGAAFMANLMFVEMYFRPEAYEDGPLD
jgi:hypothetical protein